MSDASKHSKHMTLDDRIEIQECLDHGMTFKAIVHRISMDPTTISKEVKKCFRLKPISVSSFVTDTSKEINAVCPQLLKAPLFVMAAKNAQFVAVPKSVSIKLNLLRLNTNLFSQRLTKVYLYDFAIASSLPHLAI